MTVDEFVKFYLDRWPAKSSQAFTDDARMFLSGYSGETLMRASRRLVVEWTKDRRPTVADIADFCRQESPERFKAAPGSINRKQQFEWVNRRIPELLAEWKNRNYDYAAAASANGWGGSLKYVLQRAAHYHAQWEWLYENGYRQDAPPVFDPSEAHQKHFWEPSTAVHERVALKGNLRVGGVV